MIKARPAHHALPDCNRCAHYFITHDRHFPYGCRAMQLKCRTLPQREIEQAAGLPCQTFAPRQAGN